MRFVDLSLESDPYTLLLSHNMADAFLLSLFSLLGCFYYLQCTMISVENSVIAVIKEYFYFINLPIAI